MQKILPNTILYAVIVGPGGYVLAFIMAWLLSQLPKLQRTILAVLLYLPSMTAGTTISTGLICGVKREVMAQFSFLMVLVPILGETFLEIIGGEFGASSVGALPLVLGFISAFLSGLFACKVMIALVKKAKLSWFALYCLIAAACIFIF